jgi:hypothetical protein
VKDSNPITRLARRANNGTVGAPGQMRPEIDSFYNDRNDVKAKLNQQQMPNATMGGGSVS